MKNPKTGEDTHGDQVYVLTTNTPSKAEEVAPSGILLSREKLHGNYKDLIGESTVHLEVLKSIDKFAKSSKAVLISGETGTGKELVAHALHTESPYAMHPIFIVNCAEIAENLIASELFGHERGAFTGADQRHIGLFETASGSTLFLDEIGELPKPLQSKLLRVLQEQEIRRMGGTKQIPVKVRVLAATNIDLIEAVAAGKFRRDLYERLKPLHIQLPALRERREDIPALATHFLKKETDLSNQKIGDINPEVLSLFDAYSWPGNIRELEGIISRAVLLAEDGEILPHHLPSDVRTPQADLLPLADATAAANSNAGERFVLPFRMGTTLKEVEKSAILTTLVRENGNKSKTAAVLEISLPTLRAKLHTYNGKA
ncbi:sigma-54-dependent Fis family transcriptional regulator [Candidatus Poribacteria bacterium]|nr:sigma-54-dependent Fis family transcriptional regulator [Candidatus Poribacteria bacterium]